MTTFCYAHLSHLDVSFGLRCEQLAKLWSSTSMGQYANYAGLLTSLPTVEEVLNGHASSS